MFKKTNFLNPMLIICIGVVLFVIYYMIDGVIDFEKARLWLWLSAWVFMLWGVISLSFVFVFTKERKGVRNSDLDYGYYPPGYKPKTITDQINRLREFFPGTTYPNNILPKPTSLFPGAEGYFVIPRWPKIAPTYGEAVQKVFDLIRRTREGKFQNEQEGQLGAKYLRQTQKTEEAMQKISTQQKNYDILFIPAQFGMRYKGNSISKARIAMRENEFGFGVFAIGVMILTHPERLRRYDDLWIDCAGDEFAPHANGKFSESLSFICSTTGIVLKESSVNRAYDRLGSVSGWVL